MAQDHLTPEECFARYGVHHPKVPVVRRPDYELCLEQFGENTFIHSRVFDKWTPEVKQRYSADLDALFALHGGPIFVLVPLVNQKLRKFAAQFGFEHAMSITTKDGVESEILVRKK